MEFPTSRRIRALAVEAGTQLCRKLLEPLQKTFGRIGVRSGYRSREVTAFGAERGFGASIEPMRPITSGTCGMTRAGWERQPALWSRGLLTTIGKAQIGVGSLGGFTT